MNAAFPRRPFGAFVAHYGGRWCFDPNPKGRPLIQHEDSGLTFRRACQFVMEAVFIDGPLDGWPDAEGMAAVGRASVWAFVHGRHLHHERRARGAIYFRYREGGEDDSKPPYAVEDAPALF